MKSARNLLLLTSCSLLPLISSGQMIVAVDTAAAAAYNDGWSSGDDGSISGDGYLSGWFLSSDGAGSFAGFTIESSEAGGSNLNTDGKAFGLYANNVGGAVADAYRWFQDGSGVDSALAPGWTFSMDMKVNFRGGWKSLTVRDSADTELFKFTVGNVGAGDDYTVEIAETGTGSIGNDYSSDTIFNLSFTQIDGSGGTWTITRSGGVTDVDSGTFSGLAQNIIISAAEVGGGADNNLWVNNLQVAVPEPSTYTLFLSVFALGFLILRRRR